MEITTTKLKVLYATGPRCVLTLKYSNRPLQVTLFPLISFTASSSGFSRCVMRTRNSSLNSAATSETHIQRRTDVWRDEHLESLMQVKQKNQYRYKWMVEMKWIKIHPDGFNVKWFTVKRTPLSQPTPAASSDNSCPSLVQAEYWKYEY